MVIAVSGTLVAQSLVLGVLLGGLYALLAAGLTMYFGIMRVVMIAHAAFLLLAAYLAWYVNEQTGLDPLLTIPVLVPLFFGIGYIMQRYMLERLRPATLTMMSVLLTFGIALIIEGMLGFVWSGTQRRIALGYSTDSWSVFDVHIAVVKVIAFGLAALTLGSLWAILKFTRFGQALRATIQHPDAAQLVGIDTKAVAAFGFGLGLATAAVGGVALSLDSTIFPSLHWQWIGPLMAVVVVGGLGSVPGAAIAALVLGVSQSMLQVWFGTTWAQTVFYLALFLTLMIKPNGFFGGRLAKRF